MDRGAWGARVHRVTQSLTQPNRPSMQARMQITFLVWVLLTMGGWINIPKLRIWLSHVVFTQNARVHV